MTTNTAEQLLEQAKAIGDTYGTEIKQAIKKACAPVKEFYDKVADADIPAPFKTAITKAVHDRTKAVDVERLVDFGPPPNRRKKAKGEE